MQRFTVAAIYIESIPRNSISSTTGPGTRRNSNSDSHRSANGRADSGSNRSSNSDTGSTHATDYVAEWQFSSGRQYRLDQ